MKSPQTSGVDEGGTGRCQAYAVSPVGTMEDDYQVISIDLYLYILIDLFRSILFIRTYIYIYICMYVYVSIYICIFRPLLLFFIDWFSMQYLYISVRRDCNLQWLCINEHLWLLSHLLIGFSCYIYRHRHTWLCFSLLYALCYGLVYAAYTTSWCIATDRDS